MAIEKVSSIVTYGNYEVILGIGKNSDSRRILVVAGRKVGSTKWKNVIEMDIDIESYYADVVTQASVDDVDKVPV